MKNLHLFSFASLALAGALTVTSCNNSDDSKEIANEQNDAKYDDKDKENDAEFLVDAAEINMEEIQLGELAQKNSTMPDVVALGKMMVDEHTKALADLKNLAASKSITLPTSLTEKGQDDYEKLSDKGGKDFDKDYCDMMVKGHKKAIEKFEDAVDDTKDEDIRAFASGMLPSLNTHLEHSKSCEEKIKSMK